MPWLVGSLALSIVLTVVVNLVLRVFPDSGRWIWRRLEEPSSAIEGPRRSSRRVRVIVPWKAMIVASIAVTAALYLLHRVA